MRVLLAWSSGKDSAWTLAGLRREAGVRVAGLLTTLDAQTGEVSAHGVRRELVEAQAAAVGLPLTTFRVPRPTPNGVYQAAFLHALADARAAGIEAVAFGDLFLEDVRRFREQVMQGSGLMPLFPLWGRPTAALAEEMIAGGVRARVVCVDAGRVPGSLAGRDYDREFLAELPAGVDPCGESGEFHTFAWDGPMFRHPVPVVPGAHATRDGFVYADLLLAPGRPA